MEFIDLSRHFDVKNPQLLPFSQLRNMQPVWMTQDLQISDREGNREYAEQLAKKNIVVIPIRREPPFEKYLNRSTFPRRILFEMTSRCNFLCRMCPQQDITRPKIDMPHDTIRKVIDEIDSHGIEALSIFQFGEPLLHQDFQKNIAHINTKKNLGVIWMSTNGELFNKDSIKCALDSNLTYINFSANAVTEETYKTIVDKDVFNIVQKNLERLYELKGVHKHPKKPFIRVQMIEQETTKHEIDTFIKLHYKRADIVSINMLEHVNIKNNQFGLQQRERKPLTSCLRVSRNDCFIWSNGWVGLCDSAYNGEIYLGNVHNDTLYDIWNGPERKRILDLNAKGQMTDIEFCKSCTDYDI